MENKVVQLEKAKLSLQVEVNSLKKESSELKKLSGSEIPPKTPMAKTGTSHQRKTFGQQARSKKEHQQIQQDEISKTRQVKITAEPKPSGNKPLIIIARDSLLKNINGWLMSRSKRVKVHCFPGATVSDMEDYLKPLIKKRPARIILHCGTNDLNTSQPAQVAEDIRNLVNYIKAERIDCTVSELVMRNNGLYNKFIDVNEKLRDILGKDTQVIEHSNIESRPLNNSRIHLNKTDDGKLSYNIIQDIKGYRGKKN